MNPDNGKDAASSQPTNITVTLDEHAPTTVNLVAAYRDGSGAWTAIPTPLLHETYKFTVTSPTWSFAWGCQGNLDYLRTAVNVVTFSVAERTTYVAPESCPRSPAVKITGTITHATAGSHDVAFGELSGDYLAPISNGTINFEIWRKPGTHDLYATTTDFVPGHSTSITSVAVTRGVVVNGTVSNASVDFANAVATSAPASVTISGDAAETSSGTTLYDPSGTALRVTQTWGGPPHTTRALAASQLQPGYVYEQEANGRTCPTSADCSSVEVEHWTTAIAAQDVALPAAVGAVTVSRSNTTLTATWPAYPDAVGYQWLALQASTDVDWSGVLGAGAAGSSPTIDIGGLSQLAGWQAYTIDPSSTYNGSVTAIVSSRGASDVPPTYPAASGTDRVLALRYWSVAGN